MKRKVSEMINALKIRIMNKEHNHRVRLVIPLHSGTYAYGRVIDTPRQVIDYFRTVPSFTWSPRIVFQRFITINTNKYFLFTVGNRSVKQSAILSSVPICATTNITPSRPLLPTIGSDDAWRMSASYSRSILPSSCSWRHFCCHARHRWVLLSAWEFRNNETWNADVRSIPSRPWGQWIRPRKCSFLPFVDAYCTRLLVRDLWRSRILYVSTESSYSLHSMHQRTR